MADSQLQQCSNKDIISIRFPATEDDREATIVVDRLKDTGTYAVSTMLSKGYSTHELPADATEQQIIWTVLSQATKQAGTV